mmetsp:Transcript_38486/g.37994  ORF Transcript_38486/g.37994 Transcript_38486/m.37994 type:complete len:562 (+) Transcript_38486:341-2026(+)
MPKNTEYPLITMIRELEYEVKLLIDRTKEAHTKTTDLMSTKSRLEETLTDDKEESPELKAIGATRKVLEGDLSTLKSRFTQLEDKSKLLNMRITDHQKKTDENAKLPEADEERVIGLDENIEKLRSRIGQIEKGLQAMRTQRKTQGGADYGSGIEELREEIEADLELLKQRVTKTENTALNADFRSTNNETMLLKDQSPKVSMLLKEMRSNKAGVSDLEKRINELSDITFKKVNSELFDREIGNLKILVNETLKNVSQNKKNPEINGTNIEESMLDKINDMFSRLPQLEEQLQSLDHRVVANEARMDEQDTNFSQIHRLLNDKASASLKNEVARLDKDINEINKEISKYSLYRSEIDNLTKNFQGLDKSLDSLEGRIELIKENLNGTLRDTEKLLNKIKEELERIEEEMNYQGGVIIKIKQRIDILEVKISNFDKSFSGGLGGSSSLGEPSDSETVKLKKLIDLVKKELMLMKEENYSKHKEMEGELERKVDKEDLLEFERLMRDRMEVNEKALQKSKSDLKKALRILDDKINNIEVPKNQGYSTERDDAILAKKPLEGWK